MKRLTDSKVAENLKYNMESLKKVGVEPSAIDMIYVKLASYEDEEERKEQTFVNYDPDDYYE